MTDIASFSTSAPSQDPPADEPPATGEADLRAAAIARAERRLRLLQELTEIGMDLTRSLHRQVLAAEAALDTPASAEAQLSDSAKIEPKADPPAKPGR